MFEGLIPSAADIAELQFLADRNGYLTEAERVEAEEELREALEIRDRFYGVLGLKRATVDAIDGKED